MSLLHSFLYWLGNLTGTVILIPHPTAIGNCAEDLLYGLLSARRSNKKLILFFPFELPRPLRIGVTNREMQFLKSEYRSKIFQDGIFYKFLCLLFTIYFGFFRGLNLMLAMFKIQKKIGGAYTIPMIGQEILWKPKPKMPFFSWDVVDSYKWLSQVNDPLNISISSRKNQIAEATRKELGLPADAWYVCLHVREGGFYKDFQTAERNADIANYLLAISEITSRGGWVVRMGDATMKRLPKIERVIDYPFTMQKSDLMDIYLIKNCKFYMGMQSGILDIANMFSRPIILTNMYSWLTGFPEKKGDIGILKNLYSKLEKRIVTPLEWLSIPWNDNHGLNLQEDFEYFENTPQQLLNTITEYLDRKLDWTPTKQQILFNELRLKSACQILDKPINRIGTQDDIQNRYRFSARLRTAQGFLCHSELNKSADSYVKPI